MHHRHLVRILVLVLIISIIVSASSGMSLGADTGNVFALSDYQGHVGDTATVSLTLGGLVLLCAFELEIKFDPAFLSYIGRTDVDSDTVVNYNDTDSTIYINFVKMSNVTSGFKIADLSFKLISKTEATAIEVIVKKVGYYKDGMLSPENVDPNNISWINAIIVVTAAENDIVYGDVDGDGVVTPKDSMMLARYLAGWSGIMIDLAAADVDMDGVVTPRDTMLLDRFLAGWVGYSLPYNT